MSERLDWASESAAAFSSCRTYRYSLWRRWGALCMANLFALRATDPRVMRAHPQPIGDENDQTLKALAQGAGVVVAAWGNHGTHQGRADQVPAMLPGLMCLRTTKSGHPGHPLYLPKNLRPVLFPSK